MVRAKGFEPENFNPMKNKILYLIPVTLGDSPVEKVIPQFNLKIINSLNEFIVENIRTGRRFLKKSGYKLDFANVTFHLLDKHNTQTINTDIIQSMNLGKTLGLMSEAGTPCIADPGAEIVRIAHEKNYTVIPLIGPSSILLALMASGFNGQNFTFSGYLPIDKNARNKKIKELETKAYKENQTQIFIETPYRNNRLFNAILNTCNEHSKISIGVNLTLEDEYIKSKTVKDWKKSVPELHKKTVVFLMYK